MRRPGARILVASILCMMVPFTISVRRAASERADTIDALRQMLAADTFDAMDAAVWTDVREFYRLRNIAPAWSDDRRAAAALTVLRRADTHGLAADAYGESELARSPKTLDAATFDVRLTGALLRLGRDIAVGRARPELGARHWKSRRDTPNLAATLADAAAGDLNRWLDAIQPRHAEYAALQRALIGLRAQQQKGGWRRVDAHSLMPGRSHAAVIALRQRLAASGDLADAATQTPDDAARYDHAVQDAVRSFQFHHGLDETGIADAATVFAMNVPVEVRIRQVELNLERWRRMPDEFGSRHFFVNIPSYRLIARENGKPVLELKVVVGKPGTETPILSSAMTTVVFSPYWHIPESILTRETAPAIARDPAYLSKNSLEVVRVRKSGSEPVDPSTVDWGDPGQVRQLNVQQRPGPRNALGHVKFLMPNSYNIYLHDTPSTRLFSRGGRAFSHGCVRVDDPEKLAQYVLRDDGAWTASRIDQAMASGIEQHVKLHDAIPVHIVYFTAWVDERGGLHFGPDIYKYDAGRR
jgi:L,D-transpeptidase YcbB